MSKPNVRVRYRRPSFGRHKVVYTHIFSSNLLPHWSPMRCARRSANGGLLSVWILIIPFRFECAAFAAAAAAVATKNGDDNDQPIRQDGTRLQRRTCLPGVTLLRCGTRVIQQRSFLLSEPNAVGGRYLARFRASTVKDSQWIARCTFVEFYILLSAINQGRAWWELEPQNLYDDGELVIPKARSARIFQTVRLSRVYCHRNCT